MSHGATRRTSSHHRNPTKHTKTFTGCWTCRARRIRCDETKPTCNHCRRKGTRCEGYGIRLHWVNNGASENTNRAIFPASRVDQILSTLDSFGIHKEPLSLQESSQFIECFGVFGVSVPANHDPILSEVGSSRLVEPDPRTAPVFFDISRQLSTSDVIESPQIGTWEGSSWPQLNAPSWQEYQDYHAQPGLEPENLGGMMPGQQGNYDDAFFDIFDAQNQFTWPETTPSDLEKTNLLLSCPSSSPFSPDESFLMYHYSKRVLFLFCVVDHEKSPWKTVHLPKALQAAGEISMQGSTSKIREALFNTLLAISSFLLCNDSHFQLEITESAKWRDAAEKHRSKALNLLRSAVECDFYAKSPPKYKEFLATTLSMVTMNVSNNIQVLDGNMAISLSTNEWNLLKVISGDINTCGVHLNGVLKLIRQGQKWKRKYSNKAQSLHRVYFYLRTIYESTAPRSSRETTTIPSANLLVPLAASGSNLKVHSFNALPDVFCRDLLQAQMKNYKTGIDLDFETRTSNCERIYGIPHGLLLLLTEVIDLIDMLEIQKNNDSSRNSQEKMTEECDKLEKSIMDWPSVVRLEECTKSNSSTSAKIVHHHTLAFHNALIIYFAQHVRQIGHRFLLPYIESVLKSMETIESLKIGTPAMAAPHYWPAFIAASETFDERLQDRFRRWYHQVEVYGIVSIRTGLNVLESVWEAGPLQTSRPLGISCRWREVMKATGTQLMLS